MERHVKIILGAAIGIAFVLLGALMYSNTTSAPTTEELPVAGE